MELAIQDRHEFFKRLVASGLREEYAEAIAEGFQGGQDQLGTRADLAELQSALSTDIATLETRLTMRFATFLGIAVAAQTGIITMIQALN